MSNDFAGQDVAMNLGDIQDRQVGHRCMLYQGDGSGSNVDKVVTLIARSVMDRTFAGYRTSRVPAIRGSMWRIGFGLM